MKGLYTILLCFLSLGLLFAQTNQGGFISPTDSLIKTLQAENIFYLPASGFTLYRTPNIADTIGKIEPLIPNQKALKPPYFRDLTQARIFIEGSKPQMLSGKHIFKTFDDCLHIPFYQQGNGYIKILESYYDSLWIKIDEVFEKDFQLVSWSDFYGRDGMFITVPSGKKTPLLQSPYQDSKTLLQLDDNHFDIRVSYFDEKSKTCCEGLFCYVKITEYKVHPCYGGDYSKNNIVRKLTGWVKLLDENGKRLVLHNSGGC